METLIKADIFFFISTIATVVLAILIAILLYYLIMAGKNLYTLSESLKGDFKESEEFIMDLKERLENSFLFRMFYPASQRVNKEKVKTRASSKK